MTRTGSTQLNVVFFSFLMTERCASDRRQLTLLPDQLRCARAYSPLRRLSPVLSRRRPTIDRPTSSARRATFVEETGGIWRSYGILQAPSPDAGRRCAAPLHARSENCCSDRGLILPMRLSADGPATPTTMVITVSRQCCDTATGWCSATSTFPSVAPRRLWANASTR